MVSRFIPGPESAAGILFAALKGDKSSFPCEQCWSYLWIRALYPLWSCRFGFLSGLMLMLGSELLKKKFKNEMNKSSFNY